MASPARLPHELILAIFTSVTVDSPANVRDLARFTLISHDIWTMVTPLLYETVVLPTLVHAELFYTHVHPARRALIRNLALGPPCELARLFTLFPASKFTSSTIEALLFDGMSALSNLQCPSSIAWRLSPSFPLARLSVRDTRSTMEHMWRSPPSRIITHLRVECSEEQLHFLANDNCNSGWRIPKLDVFVLGVTAELVPRAVEVLKRWQDERRVVVACCDASDGFEVWERDARGIENMWTGRRVFED